MRLPFLDRTRELDRLRRALRSREGTLLCVYGRRRLGKSRLLQEVLRGRAHVYYVADDRDAPLQRAALARQVDALLPGFAAVTYGGWGPLLERFWAEAPAGAILALDELPLLVASSPELPSLLAKLIDRAARPARHVVLCGSSQRMMQGLLLDASAPLYGRARELIRLEPIPAGWIGDALAVRDPATAVNHYAAWGGIPRYWELARDYPDWLAAVEGLALDPLGVLHREPERLLLDDITEIARAASLLALVGQGAHRVSELAGRLGVPSTSLARPLARLVDLGFIEREIPHGLSLRDTKRTQYRIGDPFLRLWYRFVEPNRSRLAAGQVREVAAAVAAAWPQFLGDAWEDLARASAARLRVGGVPWTPARRWWGRDDAGQQVELDLVAEAADGSGRVLVGEAKLSATARDIPRLLSSLRERAERCPATRGRELVCTLWLLRGPRARDRSVVGPRDALRALR